jgi:multidrug resistance efflux pump
MKLSYTVALALFLVGAVSAYPEVSTKPCSEIYAFLAAPTRTTLAALPEASDATCWAVIEKSDARLNQLNRWVAGGNPWAAQYLARHLKGLDGGNWEDALVALGEFSDHDMERLLILANEGLLSNRELRHALTMLPLSLSDDQRAQLNLLQQRRAKVNHVTRQTLSVQKAEALKAIDEFAAEVKSHLPNNSQ